MNIVKALQTLGHSMLDRLQSRTWLFANCGGERPPGDNDIIPFSDSVLSWFYHCFY